MPPYTHLALSMLTLLMLNSHCTIDPESPVTTPENKTIPLTPLSSIASAFANHENMASVNVSGSIVTILSDDTDGDRHQRFIIKLSNAQTILIVHNIDIAPRVAAIALKESIFIHGEYIWNSEGGLIHWTHHDPGGSHEDGWILYQGKTYR